MCISKTKGYIMKTLKDFNFQFSDIGFHYEFENQTAENVVNMLVSNADYGVELAEIRAYAMSHEPTNETIVLHEIIEQFVNLGYTEDEIDDFVLITENAFMTSVPETHRMNYPGPVVLNIKGVMTNFYNG